MRLVEFFSSLKSRTTSNEAYTNDNIYLLKYMKDAEFDPYKYWQMIVEMLLDWEDFDFVEFLNERGIEIEDTPDFYNIDPEIFYSLPNYIQQDIEEKVYSYALQHFPTELPTHYHMSLNRDRLLKRTTWLIHFSDNAYDIWREGFKYGIFGYDQLALTRHLDPREKDGGYNFAFVADSKDARLGAKAATQGEGYGRHAVMFQNSGVEAYHHGDEQDQVMFWGADVNPKNIILLYNDGGDWTVVPKKPLRDGRDWVYRGDFEKVVQWVMNNADRYRKVLSEQSISRWNSKIEKSKDEYGNLILFHGGNTIIDKFRTDKSSLLQGLYLTPSQSYAKSYGKIVYTVRVKGRIANLYNDEKHIVSKMGIEANKLADQYVNRLRDKQTINGIPQEGWKNFHQKERSLRAKAYQKVYHSYGYVGRAQPLMDEIIIYDPNAVEILDITTKKRKIKEMRTDTERYKRLDPVRRWIAKYTYEGMDKWPSKDILEKAVRKYPVADNTVVYRGMNFYTKEKFDEFMETVKEGKVTFNSITSWSPDRQQAQQFAITQPTYFLNHEVMRAHDRMHKEREILAGYRGIILKTTINAGQGIDVNKSKVGHENEIIVVPGEYEVEIEQIKRFKDAFNDADFDVNEKLLGLTRDKLYKDGSYEYKLLEYVLHHYKDRYSEILEPKTINHIFKLYAPETTNVRYELKKPTSFSSDRSDELVFIFDGRIFYLHRYGLFDEQQTRKIERYAAKIFKVMSKAILENPDAMFDGKYVNFVAEIAGKEYELTQIQKKVVGKKYHDINDKIMQLNSRDDLNNDEKHKILNGYQKELEELFAKLGFRR